MAGIQQLNSLEKRVQELERLKEENRHNYKFNVKHFKTIMPFWGIVQDRRDLYKLEDEFFSDILTIAKHTRIEPTEILQGILDLSEDEEMLAMLEGFIEHSRRYYYDYEM